jgi:hypothetical protein
MDQILPLRGNKSKKQKEKKKKKTKKKTKKQKNQLQRPSATETSNVQLTRSSTLLLRAAPL